MRLDKLTDDREAQSRATQFGIRRRFTALEGLEDTVVSSNGMPGPSSMTDSSTLLFRVSVTLKRIFPPSVPYRTAFDARLSIIWNSARSSPTTMGAGSGSSAASVMPRLSASWRIKLSHLAMSSPALTGAGVHDFILSVLNFRKIEQVSDERRQVLSGHVDALEISSTVR